MPSVTLVHDISMPTPTFTTNYFEISDSRTPFFSCLSYISWDFKDLRVYFRNIKTNEKRALKRKYKFHLKCVLTSEWITTLKAICCTITINRPVLILIIHYWRQGRNRIMCVKKGTNIMQYLKSDLWTFWQSQVSSMNWELNKSSGTFIHHLEAANCNVQNDRADQMQQIHTAADMFFTKRNCFLPTIKPFARMSSGGEKNKTFS